MLSGLATVDRVQNVCACASIYTARPMFKRLQHAPLVGATSARLAPPCGIVLCVHVGSNVGLDATCNLQVLKHPPVNDSLAEIATMAEDQYVIFGVARLPRTAVPQH